MIRVLELFAGIGACSKALERLGIEHEIVDAVEIDKYAIKSFNAIHGTEFEVQDITEWDKNIEVDLVMHGSPCQDFSVAGKQAGGDLGSGTRSSLMYETIRIVGKIRPKYVIWENVKNVLSKAHKHNFDRYIETMKTLGYSNYYKVLDAKDYGVPQHRERVFVVSILNGREYIFPEKQELKIRLKDILEDEVDEKYYLKDYQLENIKKSNYTQNQRRIQEKDYCDTLCARDWKDPKCVQVAELDIKGQDCIKRVYSDEGISPTLTSMEGGNRQPKIEVQKIYDIPKEILNDNERQRRVYSSEGASPTLLNRSDSPKIEVIGNYSPSGHDASRIVNSDGLAPTVKENHGTVTATNKNYRIRKLTPKECWRLMGFDDEDFEKGESAGMSNTQLYKQAGNSIVVNVLEGILGNLLWRLKKQ